MNLWNLVETNYQGAYLTYVHILSIEHTYSLTSVLFFARILMVFSCVGGLALSDSKEGGGSFRCIPGFHKLDKIRKYRKNYEEVRPCIQPPQT